MLCQVIFAAANSIDFRRIFLNFFIFGFVCFVNIVAFLCLFWAQAVLFLVAVAAVLIKFLSNKFFFFFFF
jgi:hypothetical protein